MYSNKGIILASQCDFSSNLSTLGALQIIQDAICIYFGEMGVDEIRLKRDFNSIWVFTKNKVRFLDFPNWNDKYEVKCFISSLSTVRMVVDTAIYVNKKLKIYAKTEVCVLNLETQKIQAIKSVLTKEVETTESLEKMQFDKLNDFDDLEIIKTHKVNSTSIDYCIHTNNIEYVRFILDVYESKFLLEHKLDELQINYVSQTMENDVLDIARNIRGNEYSFEIKNGQNVAVRCKLLFKN